VSRTELGREHVAGIPIARAGLDQANEFILTDAAAGLGRLYAFINAHSSKLRREGTAYARVIADQARTMGLADGASVTHAAKLLGYGDIGRCPGPDLMEAVCARAAADGTPIFLLGGAEGVVDVLADALRSRHGGLFVAGTATPAFGEWSDEENRRLVEAVTASGARILFMGVSAPKQEIWAYEHLDDLGMPIVCVGAAFDFGTGRKSRAPEWMRKAGLEWVHRLLSEPGRMWKRYLVGNTLFMWDVLRYGRKPAPLPRSDT
jgi:N-acetylglucosaminyldiphosphoundecaprenol N-acetyl-beta-D-mannosaminyltransferase